MKEYRLLCLYTSTSLNESVQGHQHQIQWYSSYHQNNQEMLKKEKAPKCAVLKGKQKHKCLYICCAYRTRYLTQESIDKIYLLK